MMLLTNLYLFQPLTISWSTAKLSTNWIQEMEIPSAWEGIHANHASSVYESTKCVLTIPANTPEATCDS